MSEERPLKVLVSAFAFSPVQGSECATGWDYVHAIAEKHKVWVIARGIYQKETEQYLLEHPESMPNVTMHYVPLEDKSFNIPFREVLYSLRYRYWQWRAYRLARALDAETDFDLVHLVNLTGFREPGYLWKLGKPFVWGPVNGLQYFPLRLVNAVPLRVRPFFIFKNLTTAWAIHVSRRPRHAASAAKAILAASSTAAEGIRSSWGRNAAVLCEVCAPDLPLRAPTQRRAEEPFRIIWSGSCEPRKALNIVLMALEKIKHISVDWRFVAVGDGPLLGDWKALAQTLGIDERCSFLGRLSRAAVLAQMETAHCFVQPSLYDGTPTVVAEALACGLPVICLDQFGCKDAVNEKCGVKIPPQNVKQVIREFAQAIEGFALDENRRYAMAVAAQEASLRLSTKYKEEVINDIYSRILPRIRLESGDLSGHGNHI